MRSLPQRLQLHKDNDFLLGALGRKPLLPDFTACEILQIPAIHHSLFLSFSYQSGAHHTLLLSRVV